MEGQIHGRETGTRNGETAWLGETDVWVNAWKVGSRRA